MFDYPVYLLYRAETDFARLVAPALLICDGANLRRHCLATPAANNRKLALRNVRIAFGDELSRNRDAPDRAPAFFDGWERICFAA